MLWFLVCASFPATAGSAAADDGAANTGAAGGTAAAAGDDGRRPFSAAPPPCRISNVFANHMVLQRGPQAASVFGFAAVGTTVKTTLSGDTPLSATTDGAGIWRQQLPATKASAAGVTIHFACSSGEVFALSDVLFGDVHLCGGQSNAQFTLGQIGFQGGFNASSEMNQADGYPHVRTMTVGQTTTSYHPLDELGAKPTLPWSVASSRSVGLGNWTATSAVCWFYAKDLFDKTAVPQGIISSNWGGTFIQGWMDNATIAKCIPSAPPSALPAGTGPEAFQAASAIDGPSPYGGHGVLFNSMIHPFAVGPMALRTFVWWQGEANCGQAAFYACAQPAMVTQWRQYFKSPQAVFSYVELERACGPHCAERPHRNPRWPGRRWHPTPPSPRVLRRRPPPDARPLAAQRAITCLPISKSFAVRNSRPTSSPISGSRSGQTSATHSGLLAWSTRGTRS